MNGGAVRVRFAPSPTGYLHIGGARTALFNWLYARKTGGAMVLRIEDTDAERSTRKSYEAILRSLEWLGLDWDEGPVKGGPYGPYVQSARSVVYHTEIEGLLASGMAYHCFCTPDELEELRREVLEAGRPVTYDGRCRRLPADEVARRLEARVPHVVRFKRPEGVTRFYDIIRGDFEFDNEQLDDFVIRKSDGHPTYNFAVVVDDARMRISHVIRGDDHLSNTPKQVQLYRAMGYRPPKFVHLPMILGSDRARLSKRHGATSIEEYERLGYTPDGLVNYLALLGWSLDDKTEFFTRRQLIEKFSLQRVSKNPAAFDNAKLDHINAEHFQRLAPLQKVTLVYRRLLSEGVLPPDFHVDEWGEQAVGSGGVDLKSVSNGELRAEAPRLGVIINVMGNRLRSVTEAPARLAYFYKDDYPKNEEVVAKHLSHGEVPGRLAALADVLEAVETFDRNGIEASVRQLADTLGVNAGEVIHPCRVALTGDEVSPDIFAVIHLLGRRKSVERLRAAAASRANDTPAGASQ
jgi:glutamyl-tRNA synthetase